MKTEQKKILSALLCVWMLFQTFFGAAQIGHIHIESDHVHGEDAHHTSVLSICEDALGAVLSLFATPVYADYEDGVECEFCGAWRYDDWKCDNGDHCGDGADGDCYSEHHCGSCGDCVEDNGLCDDCEFCFDCCECEDKCRGCYEMGETI